MESNKLKEQIININNSVTHEGEKPIQIHEQLYTLFSGVMEKYDKWKLKEKITMSDYESQIGMWFKQDGELMAENSRKLFDYFIKKIYKP